MTILEAIVLAMVEGVTEYLPVSSTGHIILTSALFGIEHDPFTKNYTVAVQFGAILAVIVIFFERFKAGRDFYVKLAVAFLPAAGIGFLVKNKIDLLLGSVEVVATALIVGGIVMIAIEGLIGARSNKDFSGFTKLHALVIGLGQCLAFVPGVSRSAATLLAARCLGYSRVASAEFSFFLAVPTLTAATILKTHKALDGITAEQVTFLIVGNIVSFLTGYLAIKTFVRYLSQNSLKVFGVYRIVLGSVIWIVLLSGHSLKF